MSCEMAALPFLANANYETWSIDFASIQVYFWQARRILLIFGYLHFNSVGELLKKIEVKLTYFI